MQSQTRDTFAKFTPIRFICTNKPNRHDKLLVAFDALVLSEALKTEVEQGKIIHGKTLSTLIVKTATLASEVQKINTKILALLGNEQPPDVVLNRHCIECEFQARCRRPLPSGWHHGEGTEQVPQQGNLHREPVVLHVRPRRIPKRAKNPVQPRYPALQALAIRENTVYIHGRPVLPASKTDVYLDVEGLPDSESYYLIGALIVSAGQETFRSFWADQRSQESETFAQFADAVCQLGDFRVLHFGTYERAGSAFP